jgi:hypothetical protein
MSVHIVSCANNKYDVCIGDKTFSYLTLQEVRTLVSYIVTAYRSVVGKYEIMTREEWASLSPQARHDLNIMQMELEQAEAACDTLRKQLQDAGIEPLM